MLERLTQPEINIRITTFLKEYALGRIDNRKLIPYKPFVIEGIENEEWIDFLRNNWREEYGELYIQGYTVRCSKEFTEFLQSPEESGIKGAYLISKIPQPDINIPTYAVNLNE